MVRARVGYNFRHDRLRRREVVILSIDEAIPVVVVDEHTKSVQQYKQNISFLESKNQVLEKQNETLRNARAILLEQNKTLKKAIAKLSGVDQGEIF